MTEKNDFKTTDFHTLTLASDQMPPPCTMQIMGPDQKWWVKIWAHTRTIEFAEDYEPDEAARIFWEAMERYMPPSGDRADLMAQIRRLQAQVREFRTKCDPREEFVLVTGDEMAAGR